MANYNWLKQDGQGAQNAVLIYEEADGGKGFPTKPTITFHPFIESFKHTLTPKITEEQFGLFSITTYYRSGVAKNTYQVGLALPSVDDAHAKTNYEKVLKLKRLADPKLLELQKKTGQVKLTVGSLIPLASTVGYIMSVDETMVLEQGFSADGYPKLIKVSFTFAVDEIYRAKLDAPAPATTVAVVDNPESTAKPKTTAEQATKKTRQNAAAGASALKGKAKKKAPCPSPNQSFVDQNSPWRD